MPSILNATTSSGLVTSADNSGSLQLATNNGTTAVTIDTSQNVGIGIAPSTASSSYGQKVVQFGPAGALSSISAGTTNNQTQFSSNLTDPLGSPKYIYSDAASALKLANGQFYWYTVSAGTAGASASPTQVMGLDSSGNLLVNTTSGSNHIFLKNVSVGSAILGITNSGQNTAIFYATDDTGNNTANAGLWIRKVAATNRSINAAGTVNASGADYAEYMTKAGDFTIAKGDVVGIDANGKLTNVFADAISFVVKSTDPSYVGGDVWFTEEKPEDESLVNAWEDRLEEARSKVDRIAFSGQVPVNVTGATAGQYIVPVNDNGAIKGEAVSNPTFEQYQIAVGKVIAIEADGKAKIIVKVA
jgi:hypothetical protein